MKSFGLVTCCKKSEDNLKSGNLIKRLVWKVKDFLIALRKERLFRNSVKKITLPQEIEILLITLPYDINELKFISRRRVGQINKFIHDICTDNNISTCIVHESIYNIHSFENCRSNPFKGEYLYKCMLANIIDEIYAKKGIKLWEIDITIIQGKNRKHLYNIIELLSPILRFLTVVSDEKEIIEAEAEETFLDSGLSVIITTDWKNAIRNTDLIINLDDEKGYLSKSKVSNDSVIINLSGMNALEISGSGTLINGIMVTIPYDLEDIFSKCNLESFKAEEFAELLIMHSLNAEREVYDAVAPDLSRMKQVIREFKKWGFSMNAFMGRHGFVRPRDVIPVKQCNQIEVK